MLAKNCSDKSKLKKLQEKYRKKQNKVGGLKKALIKLLRSINIVVILFPIKQRGEIRRKRFVRLLSLLP